MKILIAVLLMFFCLAACHKDEKLSPVTATTTAAVLVSPGITIPDKAVLKLKLFRDSVIYDETSISFEHAASPAYNSNLDAVYFAGFGQLGFASISTDGRDLSQYVLPYTQGMAIRLDLHAKTDGICKVMISDESAIPAGVHIWLKDKLLKDSVDISKQNYSFNVSLPDTSSFGKNRLAVILK